MIHHIRRTLSLSARGRAVLGAALGVPSVGYLLTVALSGQDRLWLFPTAVIGFVVAGWLVLPWLGGLSDRWNKPVTGVILAVHTLWVSGMVIAAVASSRSGDSAGAAFLIGLWAAHAFYPAFEPTAHALERLRTRLGRAVHWRVVMLWFGIIGLLWSAHAANDGDEKFQMWLNTLTVTLLLAGIAASLKVYARFRKLCTALNRQAQQLIRSLEEHRDAADEDERKKKRQEAYRSWDALHELLVTKIDTGFDLPGVFVLPSDEIEAVERVVMASMGASLGEEPDEADQAAVERLRAIQHACRGRIDALA
jgi:hypothetical protein